MFTANAVNRLTEALGHSLPGNGSTPATRVARRDPFPRGGSLVVELAFSNAMAHDVAMDGSTDTVLHVLAAAQEAGLDFTLADIDAVRRRAPRQERAGWGCGRRPWNSAVGRYCVRQGYRARVEAGRLGHVRWLGGGSGAGKSSVARELVRRFGVDVLDTDAAMVDHARRLGPGRAPLLHRFLAMSMDERWVLRDPVEMLETFHWFAEEGFELVVEDLLARPGGRVVVVEGFRLLPRLVLPLVGGVQERAVWLLPTPGFRRRAFGERGGEGDVAGRTSDPPRALENLLARDALFTEVLARQLAQLAPTAVLTVDGGRSLDVLVDDVGVRFGLRPPGP